MTHGKRTVGQTRPIYSISNEIRKDDRTTEFRFHTCPGPRSGDIRIKFDGLLNGSRPSAVPRGPSVMYGSVEAGTFFREAIRFGGGFDMISARGQFDNGGGPPPSTGCCC